MTKNNINRIIACIFLVVPGISFSFKFVEDIQTHMHLVTLINGQAQANEMLSDQIDKFDSLTDIAGGACNHEVLQRNHSMVSNFLSGILNASADSNYALESLVDNPLDIDSWRDAGATAREIQQDLFYTEDSNGNVSYAEMDRVKENRDKLVEESTKSSLQLATTEQAVAKETQKNIVTLSQNATRSESLHEDNMHTNQLLAVIAKATVSNEQINAKMLELISAFLAQQQVGIFKKAPLAGRNNTTNNNPSDARRLRATRMTVGRSH